MSPKRNKKKHKRGVILLIVASLLTLLVLIGVTFALLAQRSLDAAKVNQQINEYREPPEKMFEQVLGQILYGPSGRSSLGGHDLLSDFYGHDFLMGQLINPPPGVPVGTTNVPNPGQSPFQANGLVWGGQAYGFQFISTPINQHSLILDYYSGRVITFLNGPAAGHSTRILQYDPGELLNPGSGLPRYPQLYIEAIETDLPVAALAPNAGDTFVINGAPFNGAGAGFDPSPTKLNIDAVYGDSRSVDTANPANAPLIDPPPTDLVALLPHYAAYDPTFGRIFTNVGVMGQPAQATIPTAGAILIGGADESFDAATFHDMFLAMVPPGTAQLAADVDPTNNMPVLPSYHRAELVNYWINFMVQNIFVGQGGFDPSDTTQVANMWRIIARPYGANGVREPNSPPGDDPISTGTPQVTIDMLDRIYNITRCSIFRPMPWDHLNFSGSNASLAGDPTNPADIQRMLNVLCGREDFAIFPLPPPFPQPPPGRPVANQNLYDVDNDNDGVRDSIWIDPGLPVVTSPDGKRYKRLFAILIQDLDGRIDMNAHGNLAQITSITNASGTYYPYHPDEPVSNQWGPPGGWGLAPAVPAGTKLPRGVGYGPAEVNFLNLFGGLYTAGGAPNNTGIFAYQQILQSRYASNTLGPGPGPTQDVGANAFPGVTGGRDFFDAIVRHGVPNDYAAQLSWYASPPDVWGRGAISLDVGGHPVSAFTGFTQPNPTQAVAQPLPYTTTLQINETLDNPYELTLRGNVTNSDSPYTLVEIEKLLRYHDADAQRLISRPLLPEAQGGAGSYLAASAPGIIGVDHTIRQRLAGITSSVPVPHAQIPRSDINTSGQNWRLEMRQNAAKIPGNTTLLDLYAARIRTVGITGDPALSRVLNQLVPWEVRHGGKLDINRWLGDGFDATIAAFRDGVADDPAEAFFDPALPAPLNGSPREYGWQSPQAPGSYQNINAEHSNAMDVNIDGISADSTAATPAQRAIDRMLARQLYCRHLYCLAMLFFDPGFDPQVPHEPPLTGAGARGQRQQLFARRMAQWAVNVVDARDSDSIMTAFEYDENPWDGWHVDSDLTTNARSNSPNGDNPEQIFDPNATPPMQQFTGDFRGLVWGVEQPELAITETLAFHSRNVKDTNNDDDTARKRDEAANEDDDLDQFRVPQGSLFIELYSTRSGRFANQTVNQKARYPLELYDINGRLMLGRVSPNGWPVWRLAISELSNQGSNNNLPDNIKPNQIVNSTNQLRESASFEPTLPTATFPNMEPPRNVSMLRESATATPPVPLVTLPVERFVWFTTPAFATGPANIPEVHDHSFYSNSNAMPLVEPGQYAIVGPRPVTYVGSRDPMQSTAPAADQAQPLWGGYSPQRLEFNGNGLTVYDADVAAVPPGNATTMTYGTQIRNAVGIIADMDRTTFDPMAMPPRPIMSPAGPWTNMPPWNIGLNITEPLPRIGAGGQYYAEPLPPSAPAPAPGIPIDFYDDPTAATTFFPDTPMDSDDTLATPRPLQAHNMVGTETYLDVASVYLQRLANPNLGWHPQSNPYITVDWATIDVSVFAGDENTNRQVMNSMGMQDVDLDDATMGRPQIKWGTRQRGRPVAAPNDALLLVPTTIDPADAGQLNSAANELYFDISLTQQRHSLPYINRDLGQPQGPPYLGELQQNPNPFPWLVHLDRPYSSPFELLQVSSSAPNRLFYEFTPGEMGAYMAPNIYDPADPRSLRSPFGHLLSFFHSDADGSTSPQLQRLLDSIEVPSRYLGTERYYNPTHFSVVPPQPTAGLYRPPFNKLSRFRDPGLININTIYDREVWNAAVGSHPHLTRLGGNPVDGADIVDRIFRSRQGYGPAGQLLVMNPDVPTFFANPFRPLDAGDLMPNVPMVGPNTALSMRLDGVAPHRLSVEATFMRPDPDLNPDRYPLFDHRVPQAPEHVHHHTGRNAYFRHQALQKLGNTFTTHSNVFAVWMTIGYFEVEDNAQTVSGTNTNVVNAAHPDGLRLGQELGVDTGEIVRPRAFFIIDRSVPVGHMPGQKLNSENCVLLRRMIE